MSTATWRVGVGVGVCVGVGVRVLVGWGVANKLMDEELLVGSVLSEVGCIVRCYSSPKSPGVYSHTVRASIHDINLLLTVT